MFLEITYIKMSLQVGISRSTVRCSDCCQCSHNFVSFEVRYKMPIRI